MIFFTLKFNTNDPYTSEFEKIKVQPEGALKTHTHFFSRDRQGGYTKTKF